MTEEQVITPVDLSAEEEAMELEALKAQAKTLGMKDPHPSIGLDTLREKIKAFKEGPVVEEEEPASVETKAAKLPSAEDIRKQALARATSLVRVRVNCMDPSKTQFEGEYFSAGNAVVGNITKYVHFNVEWHVPYIIYNFIKNRKYQAIVTLRKVNGIEIKGGKQMNAYAVELLDPLTKEELQEIARRQAMSQGIEAN